MEDLFPTSDWSMNWEYLVEDEFIKNITKRENRISKRELWKFQKSYQKSMTHRWWLNEFILDSWRAKKMEFFYIYWDCPSLFCTVRPARSIRNMPLKTVQTCPDMWSKMVYTRFSTSQKVQIWNKKRYKFDFLTENRFKPRSPLRTWPKNGQQNIRLRS